MWDSRQGGRDGRGEGLGSRLCAGSKDRASGSQPPGPRPQLGCHRLSKTAPPTRHDLHWGWRQETTGQTGSGLRVWEGHRPLGVAASGQWQWRGGRRARPCAVSSRACVQGGGAGWAGGPGDINIRGQARPVICPDLEHDVQSESTGAHGLRRSPVRLGGACRHHPQAPTAVLIIRNCPAWGSTAEQGPARPRSSALMSPWEGLSTQAYLHLGEATWTREPRSNHSTQHLASEGQDSLPKVTPPARDLGSPKSGWATCVRVCT